MGTVIGSFIGGLLAIGAAILIYKKIMSQDTAEPSSAEPVPAGTPSEAPDAESELEKLISSLVKLNIKIRTTHGLSLEIIQPVEQVIDLLKDTVPQMMDRHPSESLTYELKRISGEHLPQIVKEFIDLSEKSRERHRAAFVESLGDIRNQIQRAKEIVEHNEVAEFKVMASFLKTKYSSGEI